MRATQFKPHAAGVKTARMLEVEARLGRTLEEDFRERYVEQGWGQKRLAQHWRVTRTAIFGHGGAQDLKCWVQVLGLPKRNAGRAAAVPSRPPTCEACGAVGVPLEGAHWIPAARGGPTGPTNIIKLCPNCHTRLDLAENVSIMATARGVLLARAAQNFVAEGNSSHEARAAFVALCRAILERRLP
jgi:hypothetical protein